MRLQIIKDGYGNNTGVFVPMTDWYAITEKHDDLKELVQPEPEKKKKKVVAKKTAKKSNAFSLATGIWKNRVISAEQLRKQAWPTNR